MRVTCVSLPVWVSLPEPGDPARTGVEATVDVSDLLGALAEDEALYESDSPGGPDAPAPALTPEQGALVVQWSRLGPMRLVGDVKQPDPCAVHNIVGCTICLPT